MAAAADLRSSAGHLCHAALIIQNPLICFLRKAAPPIPTLLFLSAYL